MPTQGSRALGQFKGLLIKNATLQWRRKGTNLCQLITPILLVVVVGVAQVLFQVYFLDTFDSGDKVWTTPKDISWSNGVENFNQYMVWQAGDWQPEIGNLTQDGRLKTGMLGGIRQYTNYTTEEWTAYVPYFNDTTSESELVDEINTQKNYWVEFAIANQDKPVCYTCPQAAVIWNGFDEEKNSLDYTMMVDEQLLTIDALTGKTVAGQLQFENVIDTMYNMINTAFISVATNTSNYPLQTYIQPLPFLEQTPPYDISSLLSAFLYPFALSFLLPVFVSAIVLEKEERLREMMKMMGLKVSIYWMVNYIWNAFLYIAVMALVIGTSLAFQLRFITETSLTIQFLLWGTWGGALIAMSFLLSVLFQKTQSATIVSYVVVIASVIVSYVVNYMVFGQQDQDFVTVSLMLYAPFAFYRGIFLIGAGCSISQCVVLADLKPGNEMFTIILMLAIESVLYLVLALYLDALFPGTYGVGKHPLFFLKPIRNMIWPRDEAEVVQEQFEEHSEKVSLVVSNTPAGEFVEEEDEDVAAERLRVYGSELDRFAPIIVSDVRKVYDASPPKIAVHGLCLAVEKGECFGLLGPNGAGKTTTFSILTGLYEPTSGTATIVGKDIRYDMDDIHEIMSICPQFDTMWMTLTCEELLYFYARVKGVPSSEEKDHVNDILYKVGLDQYSKRLAQNLSGGMRRRLSIGTALIGDPDVMFLDEPTTGLDPETRRHIWDVLLEEKANGKSIVLTTHSMEEADVLSDRIGIMSKGRLRALGTQLHLKNKFGEGYTLRVNCEHGSVQAVMQFIEDILPQAQLVEQISTVCCYQMAREDIRISALFRHMEANKNVVGITDWGITQTTIEDVFLRIASQEEDLQLNDSPARH